jgi:diacylglycerol kinase family enzyme
MLEQNRSTPDNSDLTNLDDHLEQQTEQLEIKEIAAFFNPNSIDAIRAFRHFDAAMDMPVTRIHSVAGGAVPNADVMRQHGELLGQHTLFVVIGGDGLAHTAANARAMVSPEDSRVGETNFLFVNGGTAGDTAKSLNRPNMLARPDRILHNGWLQDIYPMEMTIDFPDGEQEVMQALGYNSLGSFTGLAAEGINGKNHREGLLNQYRMTKRLAQFLSGMKALKDSWPVELTIDGEDRHESLDIHCLSGPIMATIQHNATELTDPGFHVVENTHASLTYLASQALKLNAGRLIDKTASLRTELSVTTHTPAVLQAGGETWRVPAETSLSIGIGEPISALTTRPELHL